MSRPSAFTYKDTMISSNMWQSRMRACSSNINVRGLRECADGSTEVTSGSGTDGHATKP